MNNESVAVYKMIIHYLQVRQCILEMVWAMWSYSILTGGQRRGTKEKVNKIWAGWRTMFSCTSYLFLEAMCLRVSPHPLPVGDMPHRLEPLSPNCRWWGWSQPPRIERPLRIQVEQVRSAILQPCQPGMWYEELHGSGLAHRGSGRGRTKFKAMFTKLPPPPLAPPLPKPALGFPKKSTMSVSSHRRSFSKGLVVSHASFSSCQDPITWSSHTQCWNILAYRVLDNMLAQQGTKNNKTKQNKTRSTSWQIRDRQSLVTQVMGWTFTKSASQHCFFDAILFCPEGISW